MRKFSSFLLRHAGLIAIIGTLLGLVSSYYSFLLYKNLRTDIQELLPTSARSILDLREVSERLESIDNFAILIFSSDIVGSKRFVIDLAEKLKVSLPKNLVASVDYRIDRELQFFKSRQALYMDLSDLEKIRDFISEKIQYETALYNPLNIMGLENLLEPHLNFTSLKKKYNSKVSQFSRLPHGFYATSDEKIRTILVNVTGETTGISKALELRSRINKAIQELKPLSYAADMEIKYSGGVEDMIEEQEALVEDLEISTVIVSLIVTLGMLVFYRTVRATLALMFSLFIGTFWTFAASYFVVGYLNANSAFLGSIVIGNGINFGIIYLARYLEERRKKKNYIKATRLAMIHTATSTWTAALAAGLSYGSLMLTDFRGFNQFGVIGLIGMVLCWISAFTVLPAFLVLLDKRSSLIRRRKHPPQPWIVGSIAHLIEKYPRWIWGFSLVITLCSLLSLFKFNSHIIETNLARLRNKDSIEKGSAYLNKHLDAIFHRHLTPLVVLPRSHENALKIAAALKEKQQTIGKASFIGSVQTLDDFIPKNQSQKIAVLEDIRSHLPGRILRRLSENDKKLISEFLTPEILKPLNQSDLPEFLLSKFTEKNGTIGNMVLVEPPLNNEIWDGKNLIKFIDSLRETADTIEPGSPVAGTNAISSDMIRAITYDGPKATLFAFLAVVILVIVLFRNVKTISLILFSLFLGVLWMIGVIVVFDLKINFLNFIALPITFGIGVDYGVNIFQRYSESRNKNIIHVLRNTGSAVALCSFSTIVGYASLVIARNQGFVSFGVLAVAGELTCIVAALISLPAFLELNRRRKHHKKGTIS